MYIMLFFILLAIGLAAYTLSLYSKILPNQKTAEDSWMHMDVLLRRRTNVTEHLLKSANGQMQYEAEVRAALKEIYIHLRRYPDIKNHVSERVVVELGLSENLNYLLAAADKYPDLKNNPAFLSHQKVLGDIQAELEKVSTIYNQSAKSVNKLIRIRPNKWIISFFAVPHFAIYGK